jgi:hypothetical protein
MNNQKRPKSKYQKKVSARFRAMKRLGVYSKDGNPWPWPVIWAKQGKSSLRLSK